MKKIGGLIQLCFFKKENAGFTMAELMVVMAIIAVLAAIGGSFVQDLYNSYMADQGAQEILTAIRDAQNRSIAVKDGYKVWAASISVMPPYSREAGDGVIKITPYKENLAGTGIEPEASKIETKQVKVNEVYLVARSGSSPDAKVEYKADRDKGTLFVFSFSAPFGRPSFYRGIAGGRLDCSDSSSPTCEWVKGTGFLGEWVLSLGALPNTSQHTIIGSKDEEIKINVVFGEHTRTVTIRSNGDASAN